jgi:hypothetical protein
MSEAELNELLRQQGFIDTFLSSEGAWTTLYKSHKDNHQNVVLYSALSPTSRRELVLNDTSWDLSVGSGKPCFNQTSPGGEELTAEYMRFGNHDGVEPLVVKQHHYGIRPDEIHLSEEFVLFHNLYEDRAQRKYYKIHDNGTVELVAIVTDMEVRVRTSYLRQFTAARQLDLLLFMDNTVNVSTEDINGASIDFDDMTLRVNEQLCTYQRSAGDNMFSGGGAFSRTLGLKIIPPQPMEHSGVWPFEDSDDDYPDFIIGEDENHRPVRHTSNHVGLGDLYLSPVFFSRNVLQKYYDDPDTYSVEDGYLRCGSLWGAQIDNDNPEFVVMFLGDIGRDLPASERHHWKSHNITPTGNISATSFNRSFMAQPANPTSPDLVFRMTYNQFNSKWRTVFAWDLFKELHGPDGQIIQRVHVPSNESGQEFDDQILGTTKAVIDSLNERGIVGELGSTVPDEKGIQKFERFLQEKGYPNTERDISLLREIQSLRSRNAAHRRSANYREHLDGILNGRSNSEYISDTLGSLVVMLNDLSDFFIDNATT